MSPLEQLTQKIIKAVPSIVVEYYQGECEPGFIERPILLEDVLIACDWLRFTKYSDRPNEVIEIDDKFSWLLNTPLHLQSEETISEINKLIK